jgi:hypothetical protein
LVKHSIPLIDEAPIKQRAYRCPERLRDELNAQISEMLQHSIIRPSSSPWASPVLLVRKKNGKFRLCIDYRKLNAQTRKDSYPLPRISDMLEKFKGARVFTSLDLMKGYYQVEMLNEDKEKTAFVVEDGLYEFEVMPFGLTGAPNTFQRLMDFLLQKFDFAMVYLDDIIIYSTDELNHVNHLRQVFEVIREANLKIGLDKCEIGVDQIQYLGHVISAAGLLPDPRLIEKVKECPTPKSIKDVHSFVGLASYYRRFVLNFAKIVKPLTQMLGKDEKFSWTVECQQAFDTLKERLTTAPILIYPDLNKPFIVQTDASNEAIGAVLSQTSTDDKEHPIAFVSRSLTNCERNYSTTEK